MCAEKSFPDKVNVSRKVTFDCSFDGVKTNSVNVTKHILESKEVEHLSDFCESNITKHVCTSEGITCGMGTYVRGPTTRCDFTSNRAFALIVDDFDPLGSKMVAI